MKSYIIGIAGEKNSGKDTVASMINYITAVGLSKANYQHWLINKVSYDATFKDRILHFADPLKDCLSIMYDIPREYFNDRTKKDDDWYVISEKRFISEKESCNLKYYRIVIEDLDKTTDTLEDKLYWIEQYNIKYPYTNKTAIIKLRTLMQYFGVNIVRNNMGQKVWINSIISRAVTVAQTRRIAMFPDIRFTNERDAILGTSLYGQVIMIKRQNNDISNHDSETIDFECTYSIDNNSSKTALFYKVHEFVHQHIKY